MRCYKYSFEVNTNGQPTKITQIILDALANENVTSFAYSLVEENSSYEEDSYEETSSSEENPISVDLSAVNLDWTDNAILKDLHSMSCKEFTRKYGISSPTFYHNRKRKPLPTNVKTHNCTEYSLLIQNPSAFQEQFGYSDKDMPRLAKEAREFLANYYSAKYPGILEVAGEFTDKLVGKKYSVSGATVCVIRKMMGIEPYQPKNNSEN